MAATRSIPGARSGPSAFLCSGCIKPLAHLLVAGVYFALGKTVALMTVFVWVTISGGVTAAAHVFRDRASAGAIAAGRAGGGCTRASGFRE